MHNEIKFASHPRRIIIDGYNVIRTNPSGSKIELQQGGGHARQWLIDLCRRAVKAPEQWFIIFDGSGDSSCSELAGVMLTVRFAAPQSADALIRDMALDGLATGSDCLIVSSDNEVRLDGCEFQLSSGFYDYLLRCAAVNFKEPEDRATEIIEKLLAYLSECGHIKKEVCVSAEMRDALHIMLTYFASEGIKPQKIARKIENLLREELKLIPEHDTKKIVFRSIKQFFEKNAQ